MMQYILIFFWFFCCSYAQDIDLLRNWAQNVLKNPGQHFVSNYEKKIFEKFCQKFPTINLLHVEQVDQNRILEMQLRPQMDPYFLLFQLDNNNSIKRVCRYLPAIYKMIGDNPETSGLQWLGKFLYRLDAGDSLAVMDLIFYKTVKVRYKKWDTKPDVISALVEDFFYVSDKSEFNIKEKSNVYYIQITTQFTELRIEIPVNLTILAETDELQSKLYEKILTFIYSDELGEENFSNENIQTFLHKIQQIYPNATQNGDTLIISYPTKKIVGIRNINYLITNKSTDKNYPSLKLSPLVSLTKKDKNNSLLFNNALPVPFYSSSEIGNEDIKSIEKWLQYLYEILLVEKIEVSDFLLNSIKGQLEYRGYDVQKISFNNDKQWQALWEVLREEGPIYFYPSEINQDKKNLSIKGIIYIIRDQAGSFYHFCEINLTLHNLQEPSETNFAITFYPYIRRSGLSGINSVF